MAGGNVRIAVPSCAPGGLEADRSEHFALCECFTLVDLKDRVSTGAKIIENRPPEKAGCMAPVTLLIDHGVRVAVVQGIGKRPSVALRKAGIEVYIGTGGRVGDAVEAYVSGSGEPLSDETICRGHDP